MVRIRAHTLVVPSLAKQLNRRGEVYLAVRWRIDTVEPLACTIVAGSGVYELGACRIAFYKYTHVSDVRE